MWTRASIGLLLFAATVAGTGLITSGCGSTIASDPGGEVSIQPTQTTVGAPALATTLTPETSLPTTTTTVAPTTTTLPPTSSAALPNQLPPSAISVDVPILMYHYVDETAAPGPYGRDLTVAPEDFEDQLEYLFVNNYTAVSFADVYLAMAGLQELPDKPVVLTFDDGGIDNYEVAYPLLRTFGFTATFFVITKYVGGAGHMNWDQLREMHAQGMSIQSHTVSHSDLRGLSSTDLQEELVGSRQALAAAIGEPSYVLCYPAGAYNGKVIEAVQAAGYVMAVTTDEGSPCEPDGIFRLKRLRVQAGTTLAGFERLLRPRT
jgi:peptidoglycan/xylan/chitin deacetylase (PgdA/CDA1 family)